MNLCKESWNADTGRYEGTAHSLMYLTQGKPIKSDWEQTADTMESKGFAMSDIDPQGLPEEAAPPQSVCDQDLSFDTKSITYPNQIMMVLDRFRRRWERWRPRGAGQLRRAARGDLWGRRVLPQPERALRTQSRHRAALLSRSAPRFACRGSGNVRSCTAEHRVLHVAAGLPADQVATAQSATTGARCNYSARARKPHR